MYYILKEFDGIKEVINIYVAEEDLTIHQL